jgi:fucose permease
VSHHAVHAPHKPVHDKQTLVSYASISMWSWFCYGLGAMLAFLAEEQDTAPWISGLHGTALAAGGVIGALVAPTLNNRFGRGAMTRLGALGAAACIVLFILPVPAPVWTLAWVFVACIFGNLLVVGVQAFIGIRQGTAAPAAFTESAALNALTGLLAPLAIGISAATVSVNLFGWRWGVLIGALAFLVVELVRGRNVQAYGGPGEVATKKSAGSLPSVTYWAIGATMCYIGAEFCISLWGVQLIEERTGLSAAAASIGLSTFLGGYFVGRVVGSGLARRIDVELLLRIAMLVGLVFFMITWLAESPWLLLPMFFLSGLVLSLVFPLCLSRVIRSAGGRTDRAASLQLAGTTSAIGIAPFVLGGLAGVMSVHTAFLMVPALILISLILVLVRPIPDAD